MNARISMIEHKSDSRFSFYCTDYDESDRNSINARLPNGCPPVPEIDEDDEDDAFPPHACATTFVGNSLWLVFVTLDSIDIARIEGISREQADSIQRAWTRDYDEAALSLFSAAYQVLHSIRPPPKLLLVISNECP